MFVKYLQNAHKELEILGCDKVGLGILSPKINHFCFLIENIKAPAAHILKQEALACGGDFALPKEAILSQQEHYKGILILTQSQSKPLLKKLKIQPFGLKALALTIQNHLDNYPQNSQNLRDLQNPQNSKSHKIMGIINATPDSFYANSRKSGKEAFKKILEMIEEGVDIIDIGGASSRPGSTFIDEKEELKRIAPIAEFIAKESLFQKTIFSIDTYTPKVAQFCLEKGFGMVNDITGFQNPLMQEAVLGYECQCVIMHMQKNPQKMQENPSYDNLFLEIDSFFARQIEALQTKGIHNIILDVGIGFGKNLQHNCELIRNLRHFKHFGLPLLVGASRKSLINEIAPSKIEERLGGTLAIHLEALRNGADIIRCHDTKEHIQALKVWKELF